MALPSFNTKSPTIKRILKEASELSNHPDPTLHAAPLECNLFEWHFTLRGPPSTPYSSGAYHGRIILPPTYPLRPPSFRFLTPSGRFEVNREICLSISEHHEETWQPAWGIRTALWALRAFMEGDAKGQVGGLDMSASERTRLAGESKEWVCRGCGGRSNEAILEEERGKADEGEGAKQDVPEELKLGFKDQMAGKGGEKEDKGKGKEVMSPVGEQQGAVQPTPTQPTQPVLDVVQSVAAPAGPAIALQAPMRPIATTPNPRVSQDGVPAWVDKAITGVLVSLALLITKRMLV